MTLFERDTRLTLWPKSGGCLFDCMCLLEEKSYHKKPVRTQNQSLRASARKCEPPMPQHQAQENKSEHDVIASDWPE